MRQMRSMVVFRFHFFFQSWEFYWPFGFIFWWWKLSSFWYSCSPSGELMGRWTLVWTISAARFFTETSGLGTSGCAGKNRFSWFGVSLFPRRRIFRPFLPIVETHAFRCPLSSVSFPKESIIDQMILFLRRKEDETYIKVEQIPY